MFGVSDGLLLAQWQPVSVRPAFANREVLSRLLVHRQEQGFRALLVSQKPRQRGGQTDADGAGDGTQRHRPADSVSQPRFDRIRGDRKSIVSRKSEEGRVDLGGTLIILNKNKE